MYWFLVDLESASLVDFVYSYTSKAPRSGAAVLFLEPVLTDAATITSKDFLVIYFYGRIKNRLPALPARRVGQRRHIQEVSEGAELV